MMSKYKDFEKGKKNFNKTNKYKKCFFSINKNIKKFVVK